MNALTLILLLSLLAQIRSYSLEIRKWSLINGDGRYKITNVTSPIDVYSALYLHSVIDSPIKGFNDVKYRWIAQENWTFVSEPFSFEQTEAVSLHVAGLDINPLIYLNDKFVGTTLSEFVSKDIFLNQSYFQKSNNILRLKFYSPMFIANKTARTSSYAIPPNCWPDEFHGECHINLIRKTQSSFGWDWGPAIPTVGIRKKVELHQTNKVIANIRDVKLLTKTNSQCTVWSADLVVKTFVLLAERKSQICLKIKINSLSLDLLQCLEAVKSGIVDFKINFPLNINSLQLWWPYEFGNPTLYQMELSIFHYSQILDSRSQLVGFRHVSLNQSLLSNFSGRYFEFYVNCKSFFVKGTNLIPRTYMTINWENKSHVEFLLNSVKEANMNTIRLFGGGKPETDIFYSVADTLGLMIWHDLMFACALYPDTKAFVNIVKDEVLEIVSKLQIHPSILVWSANNEIEALIAEGWYDTKKMDKNNIKRYNHLFANIIKPIVTSEDPYTPFVLSSPSNGVESEIKGGVSDNPQSLLFGDVHFYLYNGNLWNESSYPVTRMTTEFGFQSLPNVNTWSAMVTSEEDFEIDGVLMNHLQHHPAGNKQLVHAIQYYFGKLFPSYITENLEKYRWFSYLSQINQANILKVHINKLRSSQCYLSAGGIGLTRGAMYWQLNDNWIAPTWSTIDYMHQWKLAHYYIKNSFSEERINIVMIGDEISVTVILPVHFSSMKYNLEIICFDISKKVSESVISRRSFNFDSDKFNCNVQNIISMNILSFMKKFNCVDKRKCLFEVNLVKNSSVVSKDTIMMVYPLNLKIPMTVAMDKISIKIVRNTVDQSSCSVILNYKYIHLYVMMTTTTLGVFSNNGMHLTENETIITFNPWYHNQKDFYNCSMLNVEIQSLNSMFA